MRPTPERRAPHGSAQRGIQELEGLLLWEDHKQRALSEAETFARQLPWLTPAQQREVEHHYATVRISDSIASLEHTRTRARELRAEYATRYAQLRRRLVRATALLLCACVLIDVLLVLAFRR
jgi:hypothetical protein